MKTKFLATAALAILAAGCTNDDEAAPTDVLPADRQIRVIAGVNDLTTRAAGVESGTLKDFGLFISTIYTNIYMKKEGDDWKPYKDASSTSLDEPMLWQDPNMQVNVTAYSPYQNNVALNSYLSGTVKTNQDDADASIASDFIYARSWVVPAQPITGLANSVTYDPQAKALKINFYHKLCKLRINIKYGTELTQNNHTPAMGKALLQKTNTGYTVNLNTGIVSAASPAVPATITMSRLDTPTDGFAATFEAILVPQTVVFGIGLMVDETLYQYTHSTDYAFESGKLYRLDLTVGKDVQNITSITTSDWIGGSSSDLKTE